MLKRLLASLLVVLLGFGAVSFVPGCEDDDVGDEIEDVGDEVEDAADEAQDEMEDATD